MDGWCKTKGLSVNLKKTEVVLFTWKRKTERVIRLEYQGVKLNETEEVKYADIILVDKVMWNVHLRVLVRKGLNDLWSCNVFIGRIWGLLPKMALWLCKCVIVLKITYAVVVWWNRMDIALAKSELECQQRVPGHSGIQQNENGDRPAREGARTRPICPEPFLPSLNRFNSKIRND